MHEKESPAVRAQARDLSRVEVGASRISLQSDWEQGASQTPVLVGHLPQQRCTWPPLPASPPSLLASPTGSISTAHEHAANSSRNLQVPSRLILTLAARQRQCICSQTTAIR